MANDLYIWENKQGDLLFDYDRLWIGGKCPCECEPKLLERYLLRPNSSWDLTPYQVEGYAGMAPYRRKWQIRECTRGIRYGNGDIDEEGTLIDLPDRFDAIYDYNGYMTLQMCCIDEQTGQLIEPACETW